MLDDADDFVVADGAEEAPAGAGKMVVVASEPTASRQTATDPAGTILFLQLGRVRFIAQLRNPMLIRRFAKAPPKPHGSS